MKNSRRGWLVFTEEMSRVKEPFQTVKISQAEIYIAEDACLMICFSITVNVISVAVAAAEGIPAAMSVMNFRVNI